MSGAGDVHFACFLKSLDHCPELEVQRTGNSAAKETPIHRQHPAEGDKAPSKSFTIIHVVHVQ